MAAARAVLSRHFGYPDFRPAQAPVVRSILAGSDTLAVLPTGAGKSVCFQVPAAVLGGLTVVVSPLISLMQDQVAAAEGRGISAACLTSGLTAEEQGEVRKRVFGGELRLLYLSPERLERFAVELREAGVRPALLAVDEAHCIAEWGHDFRPSYRTLLASRYRLGHPPSVALTGSATPAVRKEIARSLGFASGKFAEHLGSFDRANLWFGVVRVGDDRDRLRALRGLLSGDDRMAIVYAPTRSVTEGVARALVAAGHRAAPYHAGLDRARRAAILDAFLADRIDVVVATCAFGMGIDKPTVRLVVHWTLPPTPESYYQEAGRAGRDGEFARCVLLWHPHDATLHRRQLDVTFPLAPHSGAHLERRPDAGAGVPPNVRESAERLAPRAAPRTRPGGLGAGAAETAAGGGTAAAPWSGTRGRRPAAAARWWATSARRSSVLRLRPLPHRAGRAARCRHRSRRGWLGYGRRSAARQARGVGACSSPRCCSGWPGIPRGCGRAGRRARGRPHDRRALRRHDPRRARDRCAPGAAVRARSAVERALEEWRAAVAREMGVPGLRGPERPRPRPARRRTAGTARSTARRWVRASGPSSTTSCAGCWSALGAPALYFPFAASSLRSDVLHDLPGRSLAHPAGVGLHDEPVAHQHHRLAAAVPAPLFVTPG